MGIRDLKKRGQMFKKITIIFIFLGVCSFSYSYTLPVELHLEKVIVYQGKALLECKGKAIIDKKGMHTLLMEIFSEDIDKDSIQAEVKGEGRVIYVKFRCEGVFMRQKPTNNKWRVLAVSVSVIMLFLGLTWSPAYGLILSNVDNVTMRGGSSLGEGSGSSLSSDFYSSNASNRYRIDHKINDNGDIIYDTRDDYPSTTPPEIPEPATLILFGLGLVGGTAFRKLRKKIRPHEH